MGEPLATARLKEEVVGSLRLAATAYHEQARDATGHLLTGAADEIEELRATVSDLLRALQNLSALYDSIWVQMSPGENDLVAAAWKQADAAILKATSSPPSGAEGVSGSYNLIQLKQRGM